MNLWQKIKYVFSPMTWRNHAPEDNERHLDAPIGWNVYGKPTMTQREFYKCFGKIHGGLKNRAIAPALRLVEVFYGKDLISKTVDSEAHKIYARNSFVLDRAFDKALEEFYIYYINAGPARRGNKTDDDLRKELWDNPAEFAYLKTVKRIWTTLIGMDTIYKNFTDFLMFNIYTEMHKEYRGEVVGHVIFIDKAMNDPFYFTVQKQVHDMLHGSIKLETKIMNMSTHPNAEKFNQLTKAYMEYQQSYLIYQQKLEVFNKLQAEVCDGGVRIGDETVGSES